MPRISSTDLDVYPLCLGGNTFGWTSDEDGSRAVLDAYAAAGGNFVDTADVYGSRVPGNRGGESEEILGRWLESRGNRDDVVVATKVGSLEGLRGLSPATIRRGAEDSLRRLRTDRIDLYYAHVDDPEVPQEETMAAFGELVAEGKVRYVAASNFSAERLAAAQKAADAAGAPRYVALQTHYNLVERALFEGPLSAYVEAEGMSVLPYNGLARGFLTGKYRDPGAPTESPRAARALAYLDDRGRRILAALDAVAHVRGVAPASVALAWLAARPSVVAPLSSARTAEQLPDLLASTTLELGPEELATLTEASAPARAG
jgi:aryl-alcohol dehydrogenase-like predicted oxidoreductase